MSRLKESKNLQMRVLKEALGFLPDGVEKDDTRFYGGIGELLPFF